MNTIPTAKQLTEDEQTRRGELIAKALYLRRSKDVPGRWATTWGSKTSAGLFRMLEHMILDGE